jgi:hypothetical protein
MVPAQTPGRKGRGSRVATRSHFLQVVSLWFSHQRLGNLKCHCLWGGVIVLSVMSSPPPAVYDGPNLPTSSPTLIFRVCFHNGHPDRWEGDISSWLCLHFFDAWWCGESLAICASSLYKCLHKSFACIWLLFFCNWVVGVLVYLGY